jgi:hypothetical protein
MLGVVVEPRRPPSSHHVVITQWQSGRECASPSGEAGGHSDRVG